MPNTLYDALFRPHLGSDRPFLMTASGDVSMSYGAFLERAAQVAHALVALGVRPGDRIVAQVAKSDMALALYAGCVQSGTVYLPLNTAYTPAEVRYFLNDCGAGLLICDPKDAEHLAPIASAENARLETLGAGGEGSFARLADQQAPEFDPVERGGDDLAALLYTSGTTGRSKGAMLSQDNLLSNAAVLVQAWKFSAQDVLLHALPIFHTHGLFVATNISLMSGNAMIFLPKFDLDAMIDGLPHATTMMGVPTFYTRLLGDARFDQKLTEHMRLFVSGSAPLLAETHVDFKARTGHKILERYGMTETNMNTSNPYDGDRRAGTVGPPLPGVEVKITHPDTNAEMESGEIGLIEVRGPNVFGGYWNMPEKTAEELRPDGFFITGDLGIIDADGYVSIVGRSKDLIISGGYNIYPKELEEILDAQPGVLESAVVGVPHSDMGEQVVALIVGKPGERPDFEQIQADTAKLMARFKCPRRYVLIDEMPRNTMGKVQKNVLRAGLESGEFG